MPCSLARCRLDAVDREPRTARGFLFQAHDGHLAAGRKLEVIHTL